MVPVSLFEVSRIVCVYGRLIVPLRRLALFVRLCLHLCVVIPNVLGVFVFDKSCRLLVCSGVVRWHEWISDLQRVCLIHWQVHVRVMLPVGWLCVAMWFEIVCKLGVMRSVVDSVADVCVARFHVDGRGLGRSVVS